MDDDHLTDEQSYAIVQDLFFLIFGDMIDRNTIPDDNRFKNPLVFRYWWIADIVTDQMNKCLVPIFEKEFPLLGDSGDHVNIGPPAKATKEEPPDELKFKAKAGVAPLRIGTTARDFVDFRSVFESDREQEVSEPLNNTPFGPIPPFGNWDLIDDVESIEIGGSRNARAAKLSPSKNKNSTSSCILQEPAQAENFTVISKKFLMEKNKNAQEVTNHKNDDSPRAENVQPIKKAVNVYKDKMKYLHTSGGTDPIDVLTGTDAKSKNEDGQAATDSENVARQDRGPKGDMGLENAQPEKATVNNYRDKIEHFHANGGRETADALGAANVKFKKVMKRNELFSLLALAAVILGILVIQYQ